MGVYCQPIAQVVKAAPLGCVRSAFMAKVLGDEIFGVSTASSVKLSSELFQEGQIFVRVAVVKVDLDGVNSMVGTDLDDGSGAQG